METQEIRGDSIAQSVSESTRSDVEVLRARGIAPRMVVVVTDSNPEVLSYAQSQMRLASELGIKFDLVEMSVGSDQLALESKLLELAKDVSVHGIVLGLPLAPGFNLGRSLDCIPAHKDIDGLTATNLGLLAMGREDEALVAATPQACILLAETVQPILGARVGMVGKGRTVGTPLIYMLLNRHATLTVCHTETKDLRAALKDCDIVFTATGEAGLLNKDMVREGQILIDAGMSFVGGRLRGDVDMGSVRGIVAAMTPVPQGVGPLTTAMIFKNLMRAIQFQKL